MGDSDRDKTEKRVAGFVARCRKYGVKVTHQRVEIMRELASTEEHPDARSVYERVRQRLPTISLDTVYRTLRLLEDNQVVSRVGSMKDRARFDANTDRHHHFVCLECGLVRDFYSDEVDRFPTPLEVAEMGSVDTIYVEMRGRCRQCREKKAGKGNSN